MSEATKATEAQMSSKINQNIKPSVGGSSGPTSPKNQNSTGQIVPKAKSSDGKGGLSAAESGKNTLTPHTVMMVCAAFVGAVLVLHFIAKIAS